MMFRLRTEAYSSIIRETAFILLITALAVLSFTFASSAEDTGLPPDYRPSEEDNRDLSDNTGRNRYGIPWHQFKNILTQETVEGGQISISSSGPYEEMSFRMYNSTTQETEAIISVDEFYRLQLPRMKRGHTYILMSDNDSFLIEGARNVYLWALAEGDQGVPADGAYEHKSNYVRLNDEDPVPDNYLTLLTDISVKYDPTGFYNPKYYSLYANLPVTYKGGMAPDGVRIRLTSAEGGTVEAVTEDGILKVDILEDNDYTVHVDDDRYDTDTFVLTVKDKSEHKFIDSYTGELRSYQRYCYDHTCCQGVDEIKLVDKAEAKHSGSVSSLKKLSGTNTPLVSVSGMDFKTLLLLVREPALALPQGSGITDYDVLELTLANPHRWEKCKVTDVDFSVTKMLEKKRTVKNVYLLKGDALEKLSFGQSGKDSVTFHMDSMSQYPVVIEYAPDEPEQTVGILKGTSIKKLKAGKKKVTVHWKKQTVQTDGYQIQCSTKKSFKKAKTVNVRGNRKTKKTIKKLRSRKKYYVRVRTYRMVNGKTYYSKWSKKKTVKVR